jgi:uncharacterized protein (TIGR01777 family)
MRVLISGGTGLIGTHLTRSLLADGHEVWILTRRPQSVRLPAGVQALGWDGRTTDNWGQIVERVDAIVNLVGERLARWPWTAKFKQRVWNSRVDGGRVLAEAVRAAKNRPRVLVQASGVNYYGPHDTEILTEAAPPGDDFLARLCLAWEGSTAWVEALGVRRIVIRSAIVLDRNDGILPIMMLPVRLFAGGPLGNGRQGLPWIHRDDEVAAIRFLLENESARGVFNLSAPRPVSSADFIRTLTKVLRRPYWLPVPAFALHLLLGEMSALVLAGEYLLPRHLLELGFRFKYERPEDALRDLLLPS